MLDSEYYELTETVCFRLIAGSFAVSQDLRPASGGLYRLFSFRCPENNSMITYAKELCTARPKIEAVQLGHVCFTQYLLI